jgi:hypothetical protein
MVAKQKIRLLSARTAIINKLEIFRSTLPRTMSTTSFVDPDNCALDARGNLKDASDIQFYDSEGDETPILSMKGNANDAGSSSKGVLLSRICPIW